MRVLRQVRVVRGVRGPGVRAGFERGKEREGGRVRAQVRVPVALRAHPPL